MKVPKDPGWFLREGGFQRCLEKREGLVSRGAEGHSIGGNRLGEDRETAQRRSRKIGLGERPGRRETAEVAGLRKAHHEGTKEAVPHGHAYGHRVPQLFGNTCLNHSSELLIMLSPPRMT